MRRWKGKMEQLVQGRGWKNERGMGEMTQVNVVVMEEQSEKGRAVVVGGSPRGKGGE